MFTTTGKRLTFAALAVLLALTVSADDGQMFRRNVSKTPDLETDHATMKMMKFYVPAQAADGTLLEGIDYYDAEGIFVETRDHAKPLVAFYHDGAVEHVPDAGGFPGHGRRDVHGAVSLDDGATWKTKNLSRSGDLSSFTLRDGTEYPGDTFRLFADVAGDRVMVAWASRYCASGSPAYSWVDEITGEPVFEDLFAVAGAQGSIDFADEDYPMVGEVPYACLWASRGQLLQDPETGLYDIVWIKPERITSGRRDVHRIEVHGAEGAGFVVTWQEDPEGLRPGKGLGPGAGWSGAIAHQQTDIWYTHIAWADFDQVVDELGDTHSLVDYVGEEMPQVAVPMAMPVRISDNAMCVANPVLDDEGIPINPYCYYDFDTSTQYDGVDPDADFCVSSVQITTGGENTIEVCVTEDGRALTGRTSSTRARVKLQPYDQDSDGANDSAWVVLAYEEMKGLGNEIDPETEEPVDIGKNVWYHTFDMFTPGYVEQGLMLNQPAKDPASGEFFEILVDEWDHEYYETEIARRASLIVQPFVKVGESGTVALVLYKQGIINQGGPADVFARRWVLPAEFDPADDNPYAYENMHCEEMNDDGTGFESVDLLYADGLNPNYLLGLCPATPLNLSGTTIVTCDNGTSGDTCADSFPWEGSENEGDPGGELFPKVTEWVQAVDNYNDQSWENPYDVAKGHRGYMDGDFIMMMYGWSPNWNATALGQFPYNLYVRRSFDGGLTWTTTPADLDGDGTEHCENYLDDEDPVCTTYGPGEFEQARNLSQLTSSKDTVLDPRFARTPGTICVIDPTTEKCQKDDSSGEPVTLYPDDLRDPSMFFVTYQTGDATTIDTESEATPLDMYYSRAFNWGDDYDLVEAYVQSTGETELRFDWLESKKGVHSAEAALAANPGGTFFYAIWNQWKEDADGIPYDSDAIFRRVMYLDDDTTPDDPPDDEEEPDKPGKPDKPKKN